MAEAIRLITVFISGIALGINIAVLIFNREK